MSLKIDPKIAFAVGATEALFVPGFAVGAIYFADKFLRNQIDTVNAFVGKHVIEPNLPFVSKVFGKTLKAHARQIKKEEHAIDPDIPPLSKIPFEEASPEEKATRIANVLVKGSLAFLTEIGVSIGAQNVLNHVLGLGIDVKKTVMTDAVVHLGAILGMSTLAAEPAEAVKNNLQAVLQNNFNMKQQPAENMALSAVFVGAPGIVATIASSIVAGTHGKSR